MPASTPTRQLWGDLLFAWRVCKHVDSNAIVIAKDLQTIGVGAGQMSRVEAVKIALDKAREQGHSLEGAVLASDAFFPFPDGPQLALDAGVRAIVQPGGSKRDDEVVAAVAEAGGTIVFAPGATSGTNHRPYRYGDGRRLPDRPRPRREHAARPSAAALGGMSSRRSSPSSSS